MRLGAARLGTFVAIGALLLACAGCGGLGKALGTRFIDLPLGTAGEVPVQTESVTVHAHSVAVDSIRFPERLSVANAFRMRRSNLSMPTGDGTGTVELALLIDGYPMANWSVAIENGAVAEVTPHSTVVPGKWEREDYERQSEREPIPEDQWEAMQATYEALPEEERPDLASDLSFSLLNSAGPAGNEPLAAIYRGMQQAIANRAFDITFMARTDGNVQGEVHVEPLTVKFFDSGQRLMGGLE